MLSPFFIGDLRCFSGDLGRFLGDFLPSGPSKSRFLFALCLADPSRLPFVFLALFASFLFGMRLSLMREAVIGLGPFPESFMN